jgi:GxxExxY protein
MSSWDDTWGAIREAVKASRNVGEALDAVSKLRGFRVTWPALKAAWSRREKTSAWNSLNSVPKQEKEYPYLEGLEAIIEEKRGVPLWYLDIRAACDQVWTQLGAGYQETFYSAALGLALQSQGYQVDREVSLSIEFNRRVVGVARADLLVSDGQNHIVVEAKRIKTALSMADENQCRAYIRSLQRRGYAKVYGFLVNFPLYAGDIETKPVMASDALGQK